MREFNEDHLEDRDLVQGRDPEKQFVPIDEVADTDNSWETFGEEVPGELSSEEEKALRSAVDKARSDEEAQEIENLRQAAIARASESIQEEEAMLKQEQAEYPAEKPRELAVEKVGIFRKIFGRGKN